MKQITPIVVALIAIALGTYLQGTWTDRWGATSSEKLERFTDSLENVPLVIGDWEGTDTEVDQQQFKASNCTGCVSRVYQNRETGGEVSLYLVSGTARHITIHTPDWCYQGAGFKMEAEPNPYTIDCGATMPPPEFSTTVFSKEDTLGMQRLRIFWSYSDDGQWTGPRWPKPAFAGRPALYKVYLITPVQEDDWSPENGPTIRFARDVMPTLNRALSFETNGQDS